jgi:N-acetylmuramoyl-L-alanine amidase
VTVDIRDELIEWNGRLRKREARAIELIVLHCTELPTLEDARAVARDSWWREPDQRCVGGHYYVDRPGTIHRFVEDDRVAHHVRGHNAESIGIEIVNRGRFPHWFRSDHQTPTEPYTAEQVEAVLALLEDLRARHPSLGRVARHEDLDQRMVPAEDDPSILVRRRIDPGPRFPWDRVLERWERSGRR